jgi:ribonuclease P protein subunit RPR2
MVRVAAERIAELFALAEREATGRPSDLADRYVRLARRIGMRYNVRLLSEYSELFCRGCSRFWVEGRTVRTRMRSGSRVRTCLGCGRERRVRYRTRARRAPGGVPPARRGVGQPEVGWLGAVPATDSTGEVDGDRRGR